MPVNILYATLMGCLLSPMMASAVTTTREGSSLASTQASDVAICILMLARDEEVLLRRNLPSWLPLLSPNGCIVGQVDDRSSDHSHLAFMDTAVIPLEVVPLSRRFVYHYSFDGLGPARTLLLQEAWHRFGDSATAASAFTDAGPLASHFFLVDPDWVFNLKPSPSSSSSLSSGSSRSSKGSKSESSAAAVAVVRQELARTMRGGDELVQAFQIFDRNGVSSRWLDWCMRAQPNLKFKYRWHEMLSVAPERYTYVVMESFTVTETEGQADSYHSAESGGSMTVARYEREVNLLTKDHEEDPKDVRVLYYLGVDYSTILQLTVRQAAEAAGSLLDWRRGLPLLPKNAAANYQQKWDTAVQYLRLRVWDLSSDAAHLEMAWASAFWLGKLLHELRPPHADEALDEEAARAYERCTELDPERVECPVQQIRLMLDSRGVDAAPSAWEVAQRALRMPEPERTFLAVPYQYTCTVPAVAARAAVALCTFMKNSGGSTTTTSSSSNSATEASASSIQAEAESLILRAHQACTQGVMDEAPSYLQELARALEHLDDGGYEGPRQAIKAKAPPVHVAPVPRSGAKNNNLTPKKAAINLQPQQQQRKAETSRVKSTLAQAPRAKAAANTAHVALGGIRKQATSSVRPSESSSPPTSTSASQRTDSSISGSASSSTGSGSSGRGSSSGSPSSSISGGSRGGGSSGTGKISGKSSALAAEIERAERESASRWLQLAASAKNEGDTADSPPGAPLNVDTVQLLVRALQAMPGDPGVQREVAALLNGSGDAHTARSGAAPSTAPLEGLSRAALLEELRAAEGRVASVLQAMARSGN